MKQKGLTTPKELAKLIKALTEQIYVGNTHLLIWENLNNYLVKNRQVEKLAPTFLGLTLKAHKDGALLHLSRIYGKGKDEVTLDMLIKLSNKHSNHAANKQYLNQTLQNWKQERNNLEGDIKKLRTLRDKFLAHLDYKVLLQIKVLDQDQKLTFGIAKNLYQKAGLLVNSISSAFFRKETAMKLLGWEDFKNLLELAKQGKKARLEALEELREKFKNNS